MLGWQRRTGQVTLQSELQLEHGEGAFAVSTLRQAARAGRPNPVLTGSRHDYFSKVKF